MNDYDQIGTTEALSALPGGMVLDMAAPDPRRISPGQVALALSRQCRFAGHSPITVAQHCVEVSREMWRKGYSAREVLAGLCHDASEAFMADRPRPVMAAIGEAAAAEFRRVQGGIDGAVAEAFGFQSSLFGHPALALADVQAAIWEMLQYGLGRAPDTPEPMRGHRLARGQEEARAEWLDAFGALRDSRIPKSWISGSDNVGISGPDGRAKADRERVLRSELWMAGHDLVCSRAEVERLEMAKRDLVAGLSAIALAAGWGDGDEMPSFAELAASVRGLAKAAAGCGDG